MDNIGSLYQALKQFLFDKHGNNTISGHTYPKEANTLDIGSAEKPFRAVYALNITGGGGGTGGDTVKITTDDLTAGYLSNKLTVLSPLLKSVQGASGTSQTLRLEFDGSAFVPSARNVSVSHGLQISSDGATSSVEDLSHDINIALKRNATNSGLVLDANGLAVGAGNLITVTGTTVKITDGANAYQYMATDGDSTPVWRNLAALIGNGLQHTTGVFSLKKKAVSGLVLDADGVAVGAGTLITVGASTVSIASGASNYQYIATQGSTTPTWRSLDSLAGLGFLHIEGVLSIKRQTNSGLVLESTGLAVGAGTMITVGDLDVGPNTVSITRAAGKNRFISSKDSPAGDAEWRTLASLAGNGISFNETNNHFHLTLNNSVAADVGTGLSFADGNKTVRLSGAFNPGRVANKFMATGPFGGLQLAMLSSHSGYTSGFAGAGYRLHDREEGGSYFEVDDLTVRGRLRVYELLIQQIRATNGSVFVTSASKAGTVTLVSGTTYEIDTRKVEPGGTITNDQPVDTKQFHSFFVNDLIRAQRVQFNAASDGGKGGFDLVRQVNLRVTQVISQYVFRAIIVPIGDNSTAPRDGDEFVRIGNTTNVDRRGSVYITSDDAYAPFIDVKDDVRAFVDPTYGFNSYPTTKVRLGKLEGITDPVFGALSGYGLFSENVYLTGKIVAEADSRIAGWDITTTAIRKQVPSSSRMIELDSSGNPRIGLYNGHGGIMLQTNYDSGANSDIMWAKGGVSWNVSSDADFRVTAAGKLFARNADIEGTVTANLGLIGGWTISSTAIRKVVPASDRLIELDSSGNPRFGLYSGFGGIMMQTNFVSGANEDILWVKGGSGWETSTGANFRVTAGGNLFARNADIAGKITADEGGIGGWSIMNSGIFKEVSILGGLTLAAGLFTYPFPRLYLYNGTGGVVIQSGDGSPNEIVMWAKNGFFIEGPAPQNFFNPENAIFSVRADGTLHARDAYLSGNIIVDKGGWIGNWNVQTYALGGALQSQGIKFSPSVYNGETMTAASKIEIGAGVGSNPPGGWGEGLAYYRAGLSGAFNAGDIVFWAGASYDNRSSAPFRVSLNGQVTMTSAVVTGSYNINDVGNISAKISLQNNGAFELVGNNSKMYSGKETFDSMADGWWIGREPSGGSSLAKFHFGNADRYIKWDGNDLIINKPQIITDWNTVTYYGTFLSGGQVWSDQNGNLANRLTWAQIGEIVMVRGWIRMAYHPKSQIGSNTYIVARDMPAPSSGTFVPSRASYQTTYYPGYTNRDVPILDRGDVFEVQPYLDGTTKGRLVFLINLGGTIPEVLEGDFILNFSYKAASA